MLRMPRECPRSHKRRSHVWAYNALNTSPLVTKSEEVRNPRLRLPLPVDLGLDRRGRHSAS